MDDTSRYRDLFFEETDEYLQVLNDSLLELERNPEDNLILDEIFRAAHTLKGMAGTMGYNTMAELTHHMENVFELFRQGSVKVTSELITVIFKCVDKLAEIVEDLRMENYFEYNIEDLIMELEQIALEDKKGKELAKEDGSKEDLTLENFLNNL
ncbi:MAG TPA: Hpt domain-containing protein, partial [Tissierellaceae bacterium]|nr:Hpt domain-containing protein [Tissierellaceae bacterium]